MAAAMATFTTSFANAAVDFKEMPTFKAEPLGFTRGKSNPARYHFGGNTCSVRGIQRRKFGNEARRNREPWAMATAQASKDNKRSGYYVLDNGTYSRNAVVDLAPWTFSSQIN